MRATESGLDRSERVKPPGEIGAADIAATVGMSIRSLH
jgi:hypothetical protein